MTPEGKIKREICEYLDCVSDAFFWVQESQGTFDPRTRRFRKKKSKYQRNGIPDISLLLRCYGIPVYVGLEVKTKTNKQTQSQIDFENDLCIHFNTNSYYYVVRSVDDVKYAIDIVRRRVREKLIQRPLFGNVPI